MGRSEISDRDIEPAFKAPQAAKVSERLIVPKGLKEEVT
jgi:hypothetical protein